MLLAADSPLNGPQTYTVLSVLIAVLGAAGVFIRDVFKNQSRLIDKMRDAEEKKDERQLVAYIDAAKMMTEVSGLGQQMMDRWDDVGRRLLDQLAVLEERNRDRDRGRR
jgi:hypothetical protein